MISRKRYIQKYHELGDKMFGECVIPTVGDFVDAYLNKDAEAMKKITDISDHTKMTDEITASVNRRTDNYSEAESMQFMQSVIAANVTDIRKSGYFYKKLASSADDMIIDIKDCRGRGEKITLPVDEDTFNYKIKNHWVKELDKYVEDYKDLPKKGTIHIRNFLTCKRGPRHFCEKCAGLFRRDYKSTFVPPYIGIYSTLMITEHATQASLDSMNKGTSASINVLLETMPTKRIKDYNDFVVWAKEIIDTIGNVGVESRFYEIALLSRWREGKVWSMQNSFHNQEDVLGEFIYSSTPKVFDKLLSSSEFEANSTKTKIAFDNFK